MILLVSNSRDFATDYVVQALRAHGEEYLRLDLDLIASDSVMLDPCHRRLSVEGVGGRRNIDGQQIKSILYRAPTHLRESSGGDANPQDRLAKHQWTAFARSLMVFDGAMWINHPGSTFVAENKPFQLAMASHVGLRTPETAVANWASLPAKPVVAVKALDSFLVKLNDGTNAFFYTELISSDDVSSEELQAMPIIIQEGFPEKIDYRVTVVGDRVFAAQITCHGEGVSGDWRHQQDACEYSPALLPADVTKACVDIVGRLGLVFGAVDLVKVENQFIFLEVNPTGEWLWLERRLGMPISDTIADYLSAS